MTASELVLGCPISSMGFLLDERERDWMILWIDYGSEKKHKKQQPGSCETLGGGETSVKLGKGGGGGGVKDGVLIIKMELEHFCSKCLRGNCME